MVLCYLWQAHVTHEDGMESVAQRLLSAAVKVLSHSLQGYLLLLTSLSLVSSYVAAVITIASFRGPSVLSCSLAVGPPAMQVCGV